MKITIDVPSIPSLAPGGGLDSASKVQLLHLVCEAHYRSAKENDCVSSAAARICTVGNPGNLNGIASAILSIGGRHAPITEARRVWNETVEDLEASIHAGCVVPGFGNSFFPKGDPKWFPVRNHLKEYFDAEFQKLDEMTMLMLEKSDTLHPNAAMYTAITCDLLDVPVGQEALLVVLPRIPAWFELCNP